MKFRGEIRERGFAILSEVLSLDSVERLLGEINDLTPRRSRAGIRHVMSLAPVERIARHERLMETSRAILGPQPFPFRATLFDKSQSANWLVVWHQDTALPLQSRRDLRGWGPWSIKDGIDYAHAPASALRDVLALRVSLDDSTSKNGPLRVLPGTHTLGVLNDDRIHELSTQIAPVDCVVPKGGVLAMRPLIVHASSKSQTGMPRRVLHIEYAASDSIADPLRLAIA
ncbi:MAG: phytanoyl-CoA dioxygenase family protein [Candidatus Sulfotelmatobacter sp.]